MAAVVSFLLFAFLFLPWFGFCGELVCLEVKGIGAHNRAT